MAPIPPCVLENYPKIIVKTEKKWWKNLIVNFKNSNVIILGIYINLNSENMISLISTSWDIWQAVTVPHQKILNQKKSVKVIYVKICFEQSEKPKWSLATGLAIARLEFW